MSKKLTHVLICLGLCLALSLSVSSAEGPRSTPSQYFPQTGHYVIGGFLQPSLCLEGQPKIGMSPGVLGVIIWDPLVPGGLIRASYRAPLLGGLP